jgi:hypothetical protein
MAGIFSMVWLAHKDLSYVIPDCNGVNWCSGINRQADKFALTGMLQLPEHTRGINVY